MTDPPWNEVLLSCAVAIMFGAAFPRLAYWPAQASPPALLAHVAIATALSFGLRQWLLPYLRQIFQERERAKEQLTLRLGREPSQCELFEHLGGAWKD